MRIKIYYKVTQPLQYNLIDVDTVKIDNIPYRQVLSFNNKSILTFTRKDRILNFELFDIHALNFKDSANNFSYLITNSDCNVILKQKPILIGRTKCAASL